VSIASTCPEASKTLWERDEGAIRTYHIKNKKSERNVNLKALKLGAFNVGLHAGI
jgi:hypothetical protein